MHILLYCTFPYTFKLVNMLSAVGFSYKEENKTCINPYPTNVENWASS
jgi:hypothetical protein